MMQDHYHGHRPRTQHSFSILLSFIYYCNLSSTVRCYLHISFSALIWHTLAFIRFRESLDLVVFLVVAGGHTHLTPNPKNAARQSQTKPDVLDRARAASKSRHFSTRSAQSRSRPAMKFLICSTPSETRAAAAAVATAHSTKPSKGLTGASHPLLSRQYMCCYSCLPHEAGLTEDQICRGYVLLAYSTPRTPY